MKPGLKGLVTAASSEESAVERLPFSRAYMHCCIYIPAVENHWGISYRKCLYYYYAEMKVRRTI